MLHNNSKVPFYLGDWCVIPEQCQLQNSHDTKHLQPKLMEVLLFLCDNQQHVLSTDDLIQACWGGQPMTDNPIHKTIAQLRKALGDASDTPKYIKTIPRKGYMLIAKVSRGTQKRNHQTPFWRDQTPFLGLSVFQPHQKDIFFGRDQCVVDFLRCIERIDHTDALLIFLTGVSGCGKSSFIQAGIIPKLLNPYKPFKLKFKGSVVWRASTHSQAADLLEVLHSQGVFDEAVSCQQLLAAWQQQPAQLTAWLQEHQPTPEQRQVLFLDQLEKLCLVTADELTAVLQLVQLLNRSKRFLIILSSRDEYSFDIKRSTAYETLLPQTLDFRLRTMHVSEQIEWVEATTQAAGLFFEVSPNRQESLFDLLQHAMSQQQYSVAATQLVMSRLYENRDKSTLQYKSLHDLGGFEGILSQRFEEVFLACDLPAQQRLIQLFPELIRYESIVDQSPVNRRLKLASARATLGDELLDHLLEQRLLTSDRAGDLVVIKFNEPHMTAVWPRLSDWVASHQNSLAKGSELHFLTVRWIQSGCRPALLIDQQQHEEINELEQQGLLAINPDHQQFLDASKQVFLRRLWSKRTALLGAVLLLVSVAWLALGWRQEQHDLQQSQSQVQRLSHHLSTTVNPALKAKGQLALLEGVNEQLLSIYAEHSGAPLTAEQSVDYAKALNVMGELRFNQRQYEQAADYFSRGVTVVTNSTDSKHNELLQALMLSRYWLGYLGFIENDFGQARTHWNDYLQTALTLRELAPDDPQWQLEHSYALNNLGSLSERTGALQEAAEHFDASIQIKRALLAKQPDDMTLQADLADSLSWQGNIYRKQGALQQALTTYQQSAAMTQQMKPNSNNSTTKLHREILAIHRMASITMDLGQTAEALALAQSAISKSLLLNQLEPQNNNYKKELISLHLLNATMYRQLVDFDQSLSHIQKANELIDYFKMNLKMTPQIAGYLMMVKREQALIFDHFEQTDAALTAIENGLLTWDTYEPNKQHLARVTYVMLHLNMAQIMGRSDAGDQRQEVIQNHLDQAWQEVNALYESRPNDAQVMAIILALQYARTGSVRGHEFIPVLMASEYRNPEFYQPLIDDRLMTSN